MGNSGFTLIESSITPGPLTLLTNIITDFSLRADWPVNLQTFFHIDFSLSETTDIFIRRNGVNYPLNNAIEVIGEVYRSIPIQKGEVINIQLGTTQTNFQFKFSLEE